MKAVHLGGFGTGDAEDGNFEIRKECWKRRCGGSISLAFRFIVDVRARHSNRKGPWAEGKFEWSGCNACAFEDFLLSSQHITNDYSTPWPMLITQWIKSAIDVIPNQLSLGLISESHRLPVLEIELKSIKSRVDFSSRDHLE